MHKELHLQNEYETFQFGGISEISTANTGVLLLASWRDDLDLESEYVKNWKFSTPVPPHIC